MGQREEDGPAEGAVEEKEGGTMTRFLIGAAFLTASLVLYAIQFIGVFRFKTVLNRMHAAALGDTLGISLALIGAMVLYGFSFATLKILLILISRPKVILMDEPLASHMLAKLVVLSEEDPSELCPVMDVEELREEQQCK